MTLSLELEVAAEAANGVVWLLLATSNAGVPLNSSDRRLLGLSLRLLHVRTQSTDIAVQRDNAVVCLNEIAARMRGANRPSTQVHAAKG